MEAGPRAGQAADPTKVYLAQQQADSRPAVGGVVVMQGAELLKLPQAHSPSLCSDSRTTLCGQGPQSCFSFPAPAFSQWFWSQTTSHEPVE